MPRSFSLVYMDILTGDDQLLVIRNDFSSDWKQAPKVEAEDFLLNAVLGESTGNKWDSVDRLKFTLLNPINLDLTMSDGLITELVRFDAGVPSVVASTEYGNSLSVELLPGCYGLSFFVEGDRVDYSVQGNFV